jgi:hypothetical protein
MRFEIMQLLLLFCARNFMAQKIDTFIFSQLEQIRMNMLDRHPLAFLFPQVEEHILGDIFRIFFQQDIFFGKTD